MKLSSKQKIGLATHLITEFAWQKLANKDQLFISPDSFNFQNIPIRKIMKIIDMYDGRPGYKKIFQRTRPSTVVHEVNQIFEKLKEHSPGFLELPKLRALEGIKTFDFYFEGDHAEALMYEIVEEAIFDDIEKLGWFSSAAN